ncbi:hypothetical protein E1B28_004778 [Marasmius oreades]|uniref:Cytochrome c oxidase assembly factor 3 n=1 Tax=Marasmius oreades TaxID=181124 RepID=A0A9P7UZA8_9AGAR|nr:uncharacterized protein E1B28_004778 [Marasmius oreades]KAG7097434.1 hypothetical protein E1B28_004778 [Marasmius oreades]
MEGWTGKYVDPKKAANSWRPKSGSMSPGLRRARQPFLVKNTITGILLGAFAVGVYAYSIRAVKQDDFDDIDEEVKAKPEKERQEREGDRIMQGVLSLDEEKEVMNKAAAFVVNRARAGTSTGASHTTLGDVDIARSIVDEIVTEHVTATTTRYPGLLVGSTLDTRFPWLLDPIGKTLVWGAPPIDHLGRVWQRRS